MGCSSLRGLGNKKSAGNNAFSMIYRDNVCYVLGVTQSELPDASSVA
ncbi:hypothetical protein [Vibrio cortegadensis]